LRICSLICLRISLGSRLAAGFFGGAAGETTALPAAVTAAVGLALLFGLGYRASAHFIHLASSSFFFFLLLDSLEGGDGAVGVGFFFFLFFEIFVVPDVGVERRVGGVARVEDDFVDERFEVGHTQVSAGGLQGVEQEAGGFVVDLLGDEQAHDLHEGDLDGVGVFEDGEDEGGDTAAGAVGAEFDALVLKAFVEKTETVAAQGGRSALGAVDFEMLTAIGKTLHFESSPSPDDLLESSG
jgi:hypothetical protein